jgi:vitamin K-dependent gamma-carboxylase-like protein
MNGVTTNPAESAEEAANEAPVETDPEPPAPGDPGAEAPPPDPSFRQQLLDGYLSFDRRTLGFTRLLLGVYLIFDLFHRGRSWVELYSTDGVYPNTLNLWHTQGMFSVADAFSSPGEVRVLWALMLVNFTCLMIGYRTRLAQVLALFFVTGINIRLPAIENGGYVVQNLLLLWTCLLPLGDRFSIDALRASMKRRREATEDDLADRGELLTAEQQTPHVTLLGPVLLIQLAAVYFFNVIHKTGAAWKNGTAVHYVIYVDRMATPLVAHLRDHLPNWAILFMTRSAMAIEAGIPVALLSPLARTWSRRVAIVLMNALHIIFGLTFVLGPFSWALCIFSTLLFSADDWEIASSTMRREHRARTVIFDPQSPGAVLVCRVLVRLDRFELLTFREGEPGPLGLAVEARDGEPIARSSTIVDIVSALPLGPIAALPLRALRSLADLILQAIERRSVSTWLGLEPVPSFVAEGPSPLRRGARRAVFIAREVVIFAFFAAAVNQAMVDLWVVNKRIKVGQPEPLRSLAHKLQLNQGWFMFSPNPVMDDGTVVVDAVTVDGRHVDPFSIHVEPYTLREPDFDLLHAKSLRTNQIWGDYFNRAHNPGAARDAMKDYLLKLPQRTGHPEDALVSGEVYWVTDMNPVWGSTESYKLEKNKLFSFENPAARSPAAR